MLLHQRNLSLKRHVLPVHALCCRYRKARALMRLTVPDEPLSRAPSTLPVAQVLISATLGCQPLPQRCCSRAQLQLPTALPCPAMGPTDLDSDPLTGTQLDLRPTSSPWIHLVITGPDSAPDLPLDFLASRLWTCPVTARLPDDLGSGLKLAATSGSVLLPRWRWRDRPCPAGSLPGWPWYCTQLPALQPSGSSQPLM